MSNIVLDSITSGYNLSKINNNFDVIKAAINADRLQLTSGGNIMSQDLDMNSNDILNAGVVYTGGLNLNGTPISSTTVLEGLGPNTVGTSQIIDGSVTLPKLGSDVTTELNGFTSDIATINTNLSALSSSVNTYNLGVTGSVNRTLTSKLNEGVSVMDFGAVGDGVTNDTAAFQAALNYATTVGLDITVPDKRFLLDPIVVLSRTCLRGITPGPFDGDHVDTGPISGPTLLVNNAGTTTPFITLDGYGSSCKNLIIYYPNQVPVTSLTPTTFPFTISAGASGTGLLSGPGHFIEGITLINSFNGISLKSGRSAIRNCMIGAFNTGIFLDEIFDFTVVENIIHQVLWDTWANVATPQPIDQWVMDHSVAIKIGRCDGFLLNNIGIFMRNQGIQLNDSDNLTLSPSSAYGVGNNIDVDNCVYGIVCYSSNHGSFTRFTNTVLAGVTMTGTVVANGIAAILAQSGGKATPSVIWEGGGSRGAWSNAGGPIAINAGTVRCRNVININETGFANPPAMPASGTTYTLTGSVPKMVCVSGGTVTQIALNGTNTGLTSGSFVMYPAQTIKLTYSVAPTWTWFVL